MKNQPPSNPGMSFLRQMVVLERIARKKTFCKAIRIISQSAGKQLIRGEH